MNTTDTIRQRRSVRTFNGEPVKEELIGKLREYCDTVTNPYDIPVRFEIHDAKKEGLHARPVITGESHYILARVKNVPHAEEAFGYSFEKMVLYAWELGLGTTIIAGTMDRKMFEDFAHLEEDERMFCVSPLGYTAKKMSLREIAMRAGTGADKRKPAEELFLEKDFKTPWKPQNESLIKSLEAVRLAPSAVNKQPWRLIHDGNLIHFYEWHRTDPPKRSFDVQKIDMGIALCHFLNFTKGELMIEDPGIGHPKETEYTATVRVEE